MKNKLKIFILRIFFRCEITESYHSSLRQQSRWTFEFKPRKVPNTILISILTIFLFIKSGYDGVIEFWGYAYDDISNSSYSIWSEKKPSESECYEKF
jgi:hypothetical protein